MEKIKKIPVIIDTDPGVDDTVALKIALTNPALDVKLVCSTAGNVDIDLTTANALYITKTFGSGVPVGKGLGHPISRPFVDASDVHGKSGIGGFVIPPHEYTVDYENGIEAMKEVLLAAKEPVTLVTLGPLSNIATLFSRYPAVKPHVDRIMAMIGSVDGTGNITATGEFNAYCDPEALQQVVQAGVPMVFAPMQIGEETKILQKDILQGKYRGPFQELLRDIFTDYHELAAGLEYLAMYDSNAVFPLLRPDLYDFHPCTCTVNVTDYPGQTFMTEVPASPLSYITPKDTKTVADALLEEMFR